MRMRRSAVLLLATLLVVLPGCGQVTTSVDGDDAFAPTEVATQALSWSIETLDVPGSPYAPVAMAMGSDGTRHIAFVEAVDDVAMYVSGQSGSWSDAETVGTAQIGYLESESLSIAVDRDDVPRVGYVDRVGALAYATRTGGAWPTTADIVSPYANVVSIAVDANGTAHLVFRDGSGLHHALQTGDGWSFSTVLSNPAQGGVGSAALALDSEGRPRVALMWNQFVYPTFWVRLGYAEGTYDADGRIAWAPVTVVAEYANASSIGSTALVLDSADHPHIAYRSGFGQLTYVAHDGSAWGMPELVDAADAFAPTIALDGSGKAHVAYLVRPAGASTDFLHYAVRGDMGWQSGAVDEAGDAGTPALVVDALDRPAIAYSLDDRIANTLRYATIASAPGDTTPPVLTPNVLGTLGDNGWYVGDVDVTWSVVDGESDIASASGCDPMTIATDTTGTTLTCTATSAGGTESQSVTIERDATAPVVRVNGVTDGATYAVGSVPAASCSTSDPTAGIADAATLSLTGGPTGAVTASCLGAKDLAGNAGSATVTYTVVEAVDPVAATESLIDDVGQLLADGVLNAGQTKGLLKPLENALRSLAKDKPLDAWNQVSDFILEVSEKVPPLTEAQASELIASGEAILAVLDGD